MNLQSLQFLTGKTFSTLSQNKTFKVLRINDSGIEIFVYSSKRERHISRREIDTAWDLLAAKGSVTGVEILNKVPSRSSAYIATMFSKLDRVTYILNPIQLQYQNDNY